MALKLGELAVILRTDNSGLKRGMTEGKEEVRRGGKEMEQEAAATAVAMATVLGAGGKTGAEQFVKDATGRLRDSNGRFVSAARAAGEQLGEGITRGADGKLRDSKGRFVSAGEELGEAAGEGLGDGVKRNRSWLASIRGVVSSVGGAFSSAQSWIKNAADNVSDFGGKVSSVAGGVWNIVQVLGAVAIAAATAVPAVTLLGGALGALPAVAVGLGAGLGVLSLGFMGLSDQFKQASSGGGSMKSVADRAYEIAQAERRVRDANREVLDSEEALSRARETAKQRMDDLNRSLANSRLDERAAVQSQADALLELRRAQIGGDPRALDRAQLAYDQASQSLDDIRARIKEQTDEQRRNTQTGVEGSDEVRAALDRQRKAVEGVQDAEHALAQARKPQPSGAGGGGAAQQIAKIAPAAAAAVAEIKRLKKPFDDLRLDVQQRLFAGVAGEIKSLAVAWLPTLHDKLGGMATTANRLFHEFADSARKPEFIRNIGTALDSVDRLVGKVGKSIAGPFTDAFGRLAGAAGPFLDAIGDELAGVIDDFSGWIKSADQSGSLKDFFKKAGDFFHDTIDMGRDVGAIIGDIVKVLFEDPANAKGGDTWTSFKETLHQVREWFDDPKNQETIREWFRQIQSFGKVLVDIGGDLATAIDKIGKSETAFFNFTSGVKRDVAGLATYIGGRWDGLVGGVRGLPGRISRAARGMFDGVRHEFRDAVNWIINHWNRLSFSIPAVSIPGLGTVGGNTIGVRQIPSLAEGGVVRATPGGRLVRVAEAGQDEAVVPLSRAGGFGRQLIELRGELVARGRDLVVLLRDEVALGGGNVQAVIGS
jgi:hypothetical protein